MASNTYKYCSCPFCGEKTKIKVLLLLHHHMYDDYMYSVSCLTCGSQGPLYRSEKQAVALWNTVHQNLVYNQNYNSELLDKQAEELHDLKKDHDLTVKNLLGFMEIVRKDIENSRLDTAEVRQELDKLRKEVAKLGYDFDHHTIHNSEE